MHYHHYLSDFKQTQISGRYLTLAHITPFLDNLPSCFKQTMIGKSVHEIPIPMLIYGHGKTKILMWSQMHGNESTTTKGLLDFLNFLKDNLQFQAHFTLAIIPILNPDGAIRYTRFNANDVDLNRDFINFSQPESVALQAVYDDFNPHYCLNLHDQRTIFGVGDSNMPASVSFLAPAFNEQRDYNAARLKAASLITDMHKTLYSYIPNQVGRFDDAFNPNCAGDHFMSLGTPTILFEAGHYPHDYQREYSRFLIFLALKALMNKLSENDVVLNDLSDYLNIYQNKMTFCDFIFKNVVIYYDNSKIISNFAFQLVEVLVGQSIAFKPQLIEINKQNLPNAHVMIDFNGMEFGSVNLALHSEGDVLEQNFLNGFYKIENKLYLKKN